MTGASSYPVSDAPCGSDARFEMTLGKLSDWRNADHEDCLVLYRTDIIEFLEGVKRLRAAAPEPVAWRWRTLPKFSEDAADQEWSLTLTAPDFINPHHHEVEPLTRGAAQGWRDISTAPKDDRRVLIAGRYSNGAQYVEESYRHHAGHYNARKIEPPTHWMPLPESPAVSSTPRRGPCQCCGETKDLKCGPSRFGAETWACTDCWKPDGAAVTSTHREAGK